MKKSFCILVLMLMALSGIYTVSAQSKAIQVNSSSVELYKQLNFKGDPTISVPAYGITIDLPKCDVYCISGIDVTFRAKQEIKISGSFVVKSGAKLTLIAPNVILDEGFTVEEGGELCIINE